MNEEYCNFRFAPCDYGEPTVAAPPQSAAIIQLKNAAP